MGAFMSRQAPPPPQLTAASPTLLGLPVELRQMIYGHVLLLEPGNDDHCCEGQECYKDSDHHCFCGHENVTDGLNLLRVNKQIHAEALSRFYAQVENQIGFYLYRGMPQTVSYLSIGPDPFQVERLFVDVDLDQEHMQSSNDYDVSRLRTLRFAAKFPAVKHLRIHFDLNQNSVPATLRLPGCDYEGCAEHGLVTEIAKLPRVETVRVQVHVLNLNSPCRCEEMQEILGPGFVRAKKPWKDIKFEVDVLCDFYSNAEPPRSWTEASPQMGRCWPAMMQQRRERRERREEEEAELAS